MPTVTTSVCFGRAPSFPSIYVRVQLLSVLLYVINFCIVYFCTAQKEPLETDLFFRAKFFFRDQFLVSLATGTYVWGLVSFVCLFTANKHEDTWWSTLLLSTFYNSSWHRKHPKSVWIMSWHHTANASSQVWVAIVIIISLCLKLWTCSYRKIMSLCIQMFVLLLQYCWFFENQFSMSLFCWRTKFVRTDCINWLTVFFCHYVHSQCSCHQMSDVIALSIVIQSAI